MASTILERPRAPRGGYLILRLAGRTPSIDVPPPAPPPCLPPCLSPPPASGVEEEPPLNAPRSFTLATSSCSPAARRPRAAAFGRATQYEPPRLRPGKNIDSAGPEGVTGVDAPPPVAPERHLGRGRRAEGLAVGNRGKVRFPEASPHCRAELASAGQNQAESYRAFSTTTAGASSSVRPGAEDTSWQQMPEPKAHKAPKYPALPSSKPRSAKAAAFASSSVHRGARVLYEFNEKGYHYPVMARREVQRLRPLRPVLP